MVSREEAARIAGLAKLALTGDDLDRAARDLAEILSYVEQIAAVDTRGVQPDADVWVAPPLRDDDPAPSLDAAGTFANAPDADTDAGLFRVPRVIG